MGLRHTLIAPHLGSVATASGRTVAVEASLGCAASVLYDALLVAGGEASAQELRHNGAALHFVLEAYRHSKAICALNEGADLLASLGFTLQPERGSALSIPTPGVILADGHKAQEAEISSEFIAAITVLRHWDRLNVESVPA